MNPMSRAAVTSILTLMALGAATAGGQTPGAGDASRTLHVAPKERPGVARDLQFRTISEAAEKAGPGDTVVIHAGTYRETVTVNTSGTPERPIRFQAAPGESVTISGADVISTWQKEPGGENVFSTPWPHRFIGWSKAGTHPGDDYHKMIGRCEQVFILGYPLLQVLAREKLGRGTFYVDLDARRLLVCPRDSTDLSKNPPRVEASVRQFLWQSKGAHIQLRGIRFRYAANMAQHGATEFEGAHDVVEDCVFESMNSSGATFAAPDQIVRRCVFRDNGQVGFGANRAHNLLFTGCVVRNNNLKGFNRGWEAGGDKLVLCRGAVLEQSQFVENRGNGVWFDIGNEKCVVRNCLIADNEDAGIFYEISFGLHAHDNVIVGNGFNDTPGAWGAAAAIALSSSPGCTIERNLMVGNREGFNFREQRRTTPLIDDRHERPVWNHDQVIRNNVLALNRDAQVWGWFDTTDGRHWPVALQDPSDRANARAAQDLAAAYEAKGRTGGPVGLSLEKLNITFANNLYAVQPGQGLFHWGVSWHRHKTYTRLEDVQAELKLDAGSRVAEFPFEDYLTRDFRVPAESLAVKMGCYPQGEVPGTKLGVLPAR
jgi:hypothetical protein